MEADAHRTQTRSRGHWAREGQVPRGRGTRRPGKGAKGMTFQIGNSETCGEVVK